MSNIQVTHDTNLNNARSESSVVINPNNPMQIVAGSKKFIDYHNYNFTLATAYSADGGKSWNDSAALPMPGFTLLTDPAMAWDDSGNVFLVGLNGNNPPTFDAIGIVIYKSSDGGKTWSAPNQIHSSVNDDKQWAAGDSNPASPFHGRVYAAWDDGPAPGTSMLRFARTLDHGAHWTGRQAEGVGSVLATDSFSPEINVAADGTVYIVYLAGPALDQVKMLVSTDGGDSFQSATSPATGITPVNSSFLPVVHGWPEFPDATFRLSTVPSACVFGKTVAVVWADYREGAGRIYYALSPDGGASWTTGPSGQPLLAGPIASNLHHLQPQIVADPNGVIGCAFYEFGPKPTTPLIDVIMAQSFDGGASFDHFTVTDEPWDPSVDAPWSHHGDSTPIDSSVTFIGEYFGLDASAQGFYPLWTDTRTGIQELWTAIVPEKKCQIVVNRSTLGQDEVDARRGLPGGPVIPDAFRVVVDGFRAAEIGVSSSASTLPTLPVALPGTGMTITPRGNLSDNLDYGPEIQRFTFFYDIDFGATDAAFTSFTTPNEFVTLTATAGPATGHAQIELVKQPDPFLLHGDTFWLSIDLKVFFVHQGEGKFSVPGVSGPADAPRFIQQLIQTVTPAQFDALPPGEDQSKLYLQPTDESNVPVFNFALAKVHYIGKLGATKVRVFFRLFQAQTTSGVFDYPPGAQYRRATTNPDGQPIALAGFLGGEYVTIPCFAEARVDSTSVGMYKQTDKPNVRDITAHMDGSEVDTIFGCWLDINQPFKPDGTTPNNVLPVDVPPMQDGPFNPSDPNPNFQPLPVQKAMLRNLHQCLIAEVAFDPIPIPPGKDPSNWDKLAQRNLAWSDVNSAQAVSTFEIRPTPAGLPADQAPDELMIDWGHTPRGSVASIYLPGVSADAILALAGRMYTSHHLVPADTHTIQTRIRGVTYIPIPRGASVNYAGLLSLELPGGLQRGRVYNIVVRQVTNAYGGRTAPPQIAARRRVKGAAAAAPGEIEWRRVLGAFQLTIPVKTKEVLLVREERDLSVLRWIGEAIPHHSRWYPVFHRYLDKIAGRVTAFGGDPGQILPSPTGDGKREHRPHREPEHEERRASTGKIAGLIFDRFGDFEGFLLDTEDGERKFFSREREVAELAGRVWRDRLRITVWSERDEPHRPLSIIIRQPPAGFRFP